MSSFFPVTIKDGVTSFVTEADRRDNWSGEDLVSRAALEAIQQCSFAAVLYGVSSPFMTAEASSRVLTHIGHAMLASVACKVGQICAILGSQSSDQNEENLSQSASQALQGVCKLGSYVSVYSIAHLTINQLVSEMGRVATAMAVYTGGSPQVVLNGFESASSTWLVKGFTQFGESLGKPLASALVSTAAVGAGLAFACTQLTLSHLTKESYPELSNQLQVMGVCSVAISTFAALSALFADKLSGDFVKLAAVGATPAVVVAVTVGAPVVLKLALSKFDSWQNSLSWNQQA